MSRRRLVSLLVSCALLVPGVSLATAQAGPGPAGPKIDGSVSKVYIVPTRDAEIYLAVVHPTAAGKIVKSPAILTYSPYSVLGRNGDAGHWTSRGFTRMYADVVGTGNSGGCYDYGGNREKRTAYDVVEWVAKQPWSSGKIGMLGGSYDGTTQYAAAVMHPPHLTTIVPEAAIVRWWDYAYSGGLRYTDSNEQFGPQGAGATTDEGADTPLGFDFGFALQPPIDPEDPDWAARVQSTITPCDELAHTMEGYSTLPNNGPFWAERDYLRLLPTVKIPVLVAANWGDWNVKQHNSWMAFHALTHSAAARLYMGTRWDGHGTPFGADYPRTVDDWFARWLQGEHNGIEKRLPLTTSATSDSSKTIGYRPVSESRLKPLRLDLGGTILGGKAAAGTAQLPWTGTATESDSIAHLDTPGRHVAFVGGVLAHDVRLFGPASLKLRITSPCDYATVTAELVDLGDGRTTTVGGKTVVTDPSQLVAVTRGWMDSRYRNEGYVPAAPTAAGKPFNLTVSLKPTDYTFHKGHAIALVLQTEALEWVAPRPCAAAGVPALTLAFGPGVASLTLPTV
ncbi:MAG: uncharacterized protein QOK42_1836 [Frankiaceae bacterium]|nr:uncharacterized protein [Frankiaceae bacterium]